MNSSEALDIWAKKKLTEDGYPFEDTDFIRVEEATESSGGCETCYFDYTVIKIWVNLDEALTVGGDFSDILDELIQIASEE